MYRRKGTENHLVPQYLQRWEQRLYLFSAEYAISLARTRRCDPKGNYIGLSKRREVVTALP